MSEGDTVVFQVRNFDGLASADVQVLQGPGFSKGALARVLQL